MSTQGNVVVGNSENPKILTQEAIELNQAIQSLFEQVVALTDNKPVLSTSEQEATIGYEYQSLSPEQRAPFLECYTKLQKVLAAENIRPIVEKYQSLQPKDNPNFTDKIPISNNDFDLYREINGLNTAEVKVSLQLKYLLMVKNNIDFADEYGQNFPDKDALIVRQVDSFIVPFDKYPLHEIATEYLSTQGYKLFSNDISQQEGDNHVSLEFTYITFQEGECEAAVKLYKLSLAETYSKNRPPLLYLNIPLTQKESVESYTQKIQAILQSEPADTHFKLLSATDECFHQTGLSSAIRFDNTHAALAFIKLINTSTALSKSQKHALLNHCSKGSNAGLDCSETPLLLAIQRGNKAVINALLETPYIDVNQPDLYNLTPLDWAFVLADEKLFQKLLDKKADPTKAYYRSHPWKKEIWTASADVLKHNFLINRAFIKDHPEYRQLEAHYWLKQSKFYESRLCNPQAISCNELLMNSPAPTPEPEFLSDCFIPYFQQHIVALTKRQQTLANSSQPTDKQLALQIQHFIGEFIATANIHATLFNTNTVTTADKAARLKLFKLHVQECIEPMRAYIKSNYPSHMQQGSDGLIMIINNIVDALILLLQKISNAFTNTPSPLVKTPYRFFEDKISTERFVSEVETITVGLTIT